MMQESHSGPVDLDSSALDGWRTKAYIVGGLLGGLVGLGAAYLYVNTAEQQDELPELKAGDAVTIGVAVLALLRQIAGMRADEGKGRKKRR